MRRVPAQLTRIQHSPRYGRTPDVSVGPRKQHVVSQVLLRRFMQSGTGKLRAFDIRSGHSKLCSPAALRYIGDYIRAEDAVEAERRWKAMEDRLPDALAAVDAGSLFELPTHVHTLGPEPNCSRSRSAPPSTCDRDGAL